MAFVAVVLWHAGYDERTGQYLYKQLRPPGEPYASLLGKSDTHAVCYSKRWQYGFGICWSRLVVWQRSQWETQILWGFIPRYSSSHVHLTNTLKQNYIPWSVSFNNVVSLEPLLSSVYLNTVYGHEFWRSQPGRYPDKYYEALSTKFRLNVAVGQQLTFSFNPEKTYFKRVKLFYEIGSCDLYIRSLFMGTDISFWDILGLSLGIKLEML